MVQCTETQPVRKTLELPKVYKTTQCETQVSAEDKVWNS